jgi:antitoxin (DNA-binding transcriptional repressor) of toxin-antitoxin stability system
MKTVNIHEAKSQLSRLLKAVDAGERFVIAKAGKPMYEVSLLKKPKARRTGFLQGQFKVPDDFDTMLQSEIEEMFYDWPITSGGKPKK